MVARVAVLRTTLRNFRQCALATALVVAVVCAGCGGPDPARRQARAELLSDVGADSLGLAEFMTLPQEVRTARRDRAATWLQHAADTDDTWDRAQALQAAGGLAPDDPNTWLDLAETMGWLGDDLQVDAALASATAAVRQLNEPESDLRVGRSERDEIVLRAALLRAWYHYGRAEWHEGLGWAKAALSVKPGSGRVLVIKGLLEAAVRHKAQAEWAADELARRDRFDPNRTWIDAMIDQAADYEIGAFNLVTGRYGRSLETADAGLQTPDEHAAEYWRDVGSIAESLGEWDYARRWYAESAAALPLADTRYRRRLDHSRLGEPATAVDLPVWLAFDRFYLTGSLSAYTAYVFARFDKATTAQERTLWGGETVNAAGILLRRDEDRAWALRARGLVFVDQDNLERGRADLEQAERLFAAEERVDRRIVATLGRVWLWRENHERALPYLERAVQLSPADPKVWSDLGLGRIMARDEEGAAQAFSRAIDLDPSGAAAWYNRGLMHLHAGDLEAAANDLGEAASLAPDNTEVARLLQRIRVMQRGAAAE